MNLTIESPVAYAYSSSTTRYGIITEITGDRAKVEWQAEAFKGGEKFNRRVKITTYVKIAKLSEWTKRIRLNDGMTLNPDGLEYRTPATA